jgi:aspartate kinase
MIVMKFGGTSVGKAERIRSVFGIVKARMGDEPVVVASALGGVTNLLLEKLDTAVNKGMRNPKPIIDRHIDMIHELGLSEELIKPELTELDRILGGVALLRESTPRVRAMALSLGERMSCKIIAEFFTKSGIKAEAVNAADSGLIASGPYESARHHPESETEFAKNIRKADGLPIITGFIARNPEGQIVTLGRSGSDYSASIVGSALGAREIQIWTDVNGIMTADPTVVPTAKNIPKMSFDEAAEVAYYGAKVIHPGTMIPAIEKGIPVRILNTFSPSQAGTLVVKFHEKPEKVVRSVVYKENIIMVTMVTPEMFQRPGFIAKVGEVLFRNGISTDIISTGEISISMTVDSGEKLPAAVEELSKFSEVVVETDMTIMAVVGDGIGEDAAVAAKVFDVLAKAGVHPAMISQSATRISISFLIKNSEIMTAVAALHKAFFGQ